MLWVLIGFGGLGATDSVCGLTGWGFGLGGLCWGIGDCVRGLGGVRGACEDRFWGLAD